MNTKASYKKKESSMSGTRGRVNTASSTKFCYPFQLSYSKLDNNLDAEITAVALIFSQACTKALFCSPYFHLFQ